METNGSLNKKNDKRDWVSLVPYGLNEQHPNAYKDILDTVWENRDSLGYAWRILQNGCCDGCSLGTIGMKDWTMTGVHLCALRLKLLRLNTMPALDWHLLEDVEALRKVPSRSLAKLGRLSVPMVRRRGERGFRRISWEEAIGIAAEGVKATDPHRLGWFLTSRGTDQRSLLRASKSRALLWHEPRRYQRANLPCTQHGGVERNHRLRRDDLLVLRLDRKRSSDFCGLEHRQ